MLVRNDVQCDVCEVLASRMQVRFTDHDEVHVDMPGHVEHHFQCPVAELYALEHTVLPSTAWQAPRDCTWGCILEACHTSICLDMLPCLHT